MLTELLNLMKLRPDLGFFMPSSLKTDSRLQVSSTTPMPTQAQGVSQGELLQMLITGEHSEC